MQGTTAHFFRIFPHTVVTLVANEVNLPKFLDCVPLLTSQLIMAQYRKIRGEDTSKAV